MKAIISTLSHEDLLTAEPGVYQLPDLEWRREYCAPLDAWVEGNYRLYARVSGNSGPLQAGFDIAVRPDGKQIIKQWCWDGDTRATPVQPETQCDFIASGPYNEPSWRVTEYQRDGDHGLASCGVIATFHGPDAEERAHEYVALKAAAQSK